jgi:hypothetical protein
VGARSTFLLLAALASGCASTASSRGNVPLSVRVKPAPVPTAAGTMIDYELGVGKVSALGLEPSRVEVRSGSAGGEVLKTYEGAELARYLVPTPEGWPDVAVVLVGLNLPAGAPVPGELHHAVTFADGSVASGGVATVSTAAPVAILPPVMGERWWMANGPTTLPIYHRNARIPAGAVDYYSERFAIDFLQLGKDGLPFSGDGSRNVDWYCYGADLLAVADGTIVDARDGVPENLPMAGRAVPMTMQNIGGNSIVLDVGDRHDRFAFYAHAIPGSLTVKIGDRVKAGQVLGKLGNSGNSDAPHLHFHVCDGVGPLGTANESLYCDGLPFVVPSFVLLGVTGPEFMVDRRPWSPAGAPQLRTDELPLKDQVVNFGR